MPVAGCCLTYGILSLPFWYDSLPWVPLTAKKDFKTFWSRMPSGCWRTNKIINFNDVADGEQETPTSAEWFEKNAGMKEKAACYERSRSETAKRSESRNSQKR